MRQQHRIAAGDPSRRHFLLERNGKRLVNPRSASRRDRLSRSDRRGSDPGRDPLYAFVFLVALGEDYNIFMISPSIWQKRKTMPLKQAIKDGVGETGAVITSAGLILAGTFAVLATLSPAHRELDATQASGRRKTAAPIPRRACPI